jgi:predicted secreted Zn-dependent protease
MGFTMVIINAFILLILSSVCATKTQENGLENLPNVSVIYYDIYGSSVKELRREMHAKHPSGFDGFNGDATTKWSIRWTWKGYGTNQCDLSSAKVTYSIQVIMPRWTPPENANPELVARWNKYIQALNEHEKGHVDYVIAHYQSVREAILGAICSTADAAAKAALDPIRQHDVEYDAETKHGATQGARFP